MSQRLCYVWLLPLLESPYGSVAANLPSALAGLNIKQPLPETVDLRQLLLSALESDSEYWAQRAVIWLEDGFPLDRELCATLLHQVAGKRFSQSLRHRLTPLGKRWLRQHNQAR